MGTRKITVNITEEDYERYKILKERGITWKEIVETGLKYVESPKHKERELVNYIKELLDKFDSIKNEVILALADAINVLSSFNKRLEEFMNEYLGNLRARIDKLEAENKKLKEIIARYNEDKQLRVALEH